MGGGAACGLLLAGVVALALGGLTPLVTAIVAGALALVLVGVGVALSRAVGHAGAGAVIGHAALPYAFLAGLLAPAAGAAWGPWDRRRCSARWPAPPWWRPSAAPRSPAACPASSARPSPPWWARCARPW
ncbi:hypothetical protein ACFQ0B_03350 [Nonomuraea thailandensis]